jgi:hypothetical protein
MNIKELTESILSDLDVNMAELPVCTMHLWHSRRTTGEVTLRLQVDPSLQGDTPDSIAARRALLADLEPTVFSVGKDCPLHESKIYAIFLGDKPRVYSLAVDASGGVTAFMRFTLTEATPHFAVEVMTVEGFKREMAGEWEVLAGDGDEDDDDEPEQPTPNGSTLSP